MVLTFPPYGEGYRKSSPVTFCPEGYEFLSMLHLLKHLLFPLVFLYIHICYVLLHLKFACSCRITWPSMAIFFYLWPVQRAWQKLASYKIDDILVRAGVLRDMRVVMYSPRQYVL